MMVFESDGIKKYFFEYEKITATEFYYEWKKGNLKKYVKSEEIPDYENEQDPIRTIVHNNFN